jgi:hypothetical protein
MTDRDMLWKAMRLSGASASNPVNAMHEIRCEGDRV